MKMTRTLYASTTSALNASGGTESIALSNTAKRPVRIVRVRTVCLVDEGGSTGPGGYAGEGLDYVKARLQTKSDPEVHLPRPTQTPLRLWADGHPPHKHKPVLLPFEGATIDITNTHPTRKVGVHFAIDVEEA